MKDSFYFPHDYHARHDPKLSALIKTFGMTGYGVYWNLVEILHEQGGKIEKFPKMYEGLARELSIDEAPLKQIISASINDFKLFNEDKNYIWSDRALHNLKEREAKRLQKAAAGRLGGILSGKKRSKTKHCFNKTKQTNQRKGKERKGNKRKEEEKTIPLAGLIFKESFIKSKKEIYPALDIEAEICSCVDWHKTKNTKTVKTQCWERAITNWLKISFRDRGVVGKAKQNNSKFTYTDPKDSICPKCNTLYAIKKDGSKTCNCPVNKEGVEKVDDIVSGVLGKKEIV